MEAVADSVEVSREEAERAEKVGVNVYTLNV